MLVAEKQTIAAVGKQTKPDAGKQTIAAAGKQTKPDAGKQTIAAAGKQTKPDAGKQTIAAAGKQTKPDAEKQQLPTAKNPPRPVTVSSSESSEEELEDPEVQIGDPEDIPMQTHADPCFHPATTSTAHNSVCHHPDQQANNHHGKCKCNHTNIVQTDRGDVDTDRRAARGQTAALPGKEDHHNRNGTGWDGYRQSRR